MGYGSLYGSQFGFEPLGEAGGGFAYSVTQSDTVTTSDTGSRTQSAHRIETDNPTATDAHSYTVGTPYAVSHADVVTVFSTHQIVPIDYEVSHSDTVTASDAGASSPEFGASDQPSTGPANYRIYEPVVDLNMVQAVLTTRARRYLSRAVTDGTALRPNRFEFGAGWENPRWGELPKPSPDATEVGSVLYEGYLGADMEIEEANASTLAIRCGGDVAPAYSPAEVMVYAQIRNSPYSSENYREIPFACAVFPQWFHSPGQRFVTRIVIPLGDGTRVRVDVPPPRVLGADNVSVSDALTVVLTPV